VTQESIERAEEIGALSVASILQGEKSLTLDIFRTYAVDGNCMVGFCRYRQITSTTAALAKSGVRTIAVRSGGWDDSDLDGAVADP
jgi:hypothetical protein